MPFPSKKGSLLVRRATNSKNPLFKNKIPDTATDSSSKSTETTKEQESSTEFSTIFSSVTINTKAGSSMKMPSSVFSSGAVQKRENVIDWDADSDPQEGADDDLVFNEKIDQKLDEHQFNKKSDESQTKNEKDKPIYCRFTVKKKRTFTRPFFDKFHKHLETVNDLNEAKAKLFNYHKNVNEAFCNLKPNMIIVMEGNPTKKALLCHQEILENSSSYFFQKIHRFYDERDFLVQKKQNQNLDNIDHFPVIDLSDYPHEQVSACIECFYTHKLEIQHNDITKDMEMLVREIGSKYLTDRFRVIDRKWVQYNLYQHGDSEAYAKKDKKRKNNNRGYYYGNRIEHRGRKRVGEEDIDNLTRPSKYTRRYRDFDDNSSSVMSICTKFSSASMASSHHNSIINGASHVRDQFSNAKRMMKNSSSRKF